MGRLHSKGKGISSSALPYSRSAPAWLKTTPDQVVDQICKLAKKGATPSQIGVVLRDSHGVAQVKIVTGMLEDMECAIASGDKMLIKFCRKQDPPYPQVQRYATTCVKESPERQMTVGKRWNTIHDKHVKQCLCLVSD